MSAKTVKPGTPAAVVELFPRRAPVPRTLPDVLDRVFQLQYTSRLALDAEFFERISHIVDLVARIDAALPPDSDIRDDPTYRQIRAHRRIDHLNVVTSSLPIDESATADFSRASIETRIRAGYDDAVAQGIGNPRAPGLRFGGGGPGGRGPAPVRPDAGGAHEVVGRPAIWSPAPSLGQPSSAHVRLRRPSFGAPSAVPS
jgi:hypothetical protein